MRRNREEAPEYVEGREYNDRELELMADEILRQDARSELCRECGGRAIETGITKMVPQYDYVDDDGNVLVLVFPQYRCADDESHTWYQGEGQARSIQGSNPILFEEHLAARRRREIYTTVGTPDPSIQQGIYHRTHPDGRPTNSEEQRRKHGASFYRG